MLAHIMHLSNRLRHSYSTTRTAPLAAICVIGNEVLTGKTHDTNSHYLAKFLYRRGIDLIRVTVIPDVLETIACTVKELSEMVHSDGYVVTTGGIGPTHDDITYEGVARAFGVELALHEPTYIALQKHLAMKHHAQELNDERKRMAILPKTCEVLQTESWVPLVKIKNVHILPGIPRMLESMMEYNKEHFSGAKIYRAAVHTAQMEGDLAREVRAIQNCHLNVAIGSYVNLTADKTGTRDASYNTRLTVDGRDYDEVEIVASKLIAVTQGVRKYEST